MRSSPALLLLPLLLAAVLPAQSAPGGPPTTNLPVRSVMLFSSGVGYFEHAATVRGDGSAELRFKTAQINDILKSLTLQDLDGGRVSTVTYPSQDPIAKTLRSFQVDITGNPGMPALLNQLRGARIAVAVGAERLTGTILGVESRRKAVEQGAPLDVATLNLLSGATIRSIELPTITALTLDDPLLQSELTRALAALSQARDQDKKPVTINFLGNGPRRVRIGYVVETPIWKTSYRLLVDDKAGWLQGWAIVENQTESDWNDVDLSLVSGRPISFVMDLYQPLYLTRPTVVPELLEGLRPQRYSDGTTPARLDPRDAVPLVPRDQVATKQLSALDDASLTTRAAAAEFGAAQGGIAAITVLSAATTRKLGELFQYTIGNVTLARQQSAMLPIVTDSVGIERVSIFNANVQADHPLNGVRLLNRTGKHLQQGPVTVLEKGSYAGDAQIEDIPPGQRRLLSYGIDLELLVDDSQDSSTSTVVTVKAAKGVLQVERKEISSQTYRITNKGSRDKTILIEHPVTPGAVFADGLRPVESTPTVHRFEGVVPAGKTTAMVIREAHNRTESIALRRTSADALLRYSREGAIPAATRAALEKAAAMQQALADLDGQVAARTTQLAEIATEQNRIRENLKSVEAKSAYAERLLAKLNEQESSIERLQRERDDLVGKRDTQRRAVDEYFNTLTLD